ncbi:MAG: Ig-like domain-containing protein [Chloroflexi bacterium]|nr:Ig-like domain-containing protein [Chloroflexota bacterium]
MSISTLGSTYFQNFDTLANTGSGTALPTGWATQETGNGSAVNGIYTVGTGSGISGDTYSFGNATGNTERALGGLFSGSLKPILGAAFKNDTGTPATHIDIAYTGEHWRFGALGRVSDRLDFQYSLDASSLVTGTWTDVDALDFTSPTTPATTGPLNGNVAPNRTAISGTIVAVVPPGATLWIRWNDFDAAPGADDGLAVDDFSLVLRSQEVAPTVSSTSPAAGSEGAAVDTDLAVTFSEPVAVSGNWFDISCGTTGGHTATVTGGSQSYTLDPDANFAAGETCTATIYAANVTDLDRADPPDNMAANYTWVFTTIDNSVCGDQATRIHTVQGSGLASPIVGSKVTVEGVVIGDYQATGQLGGFYVQEEDADADGDPATSEGIFIFSTLRDVAVGDVVRVRGTVSEFFDLTELSSVDRIESCGTGASVTPATVTLPVPSMTYFERYEGVLVTFPQTLTATETFNLGRYGEVRLAEGGRLYVPSTQTVPTDAAAYNALEDANNRRSFILDDGNGQQNIDPTIHPVGGLSAPNTLRSGYTATGLTGVFDYRFSTYRLQPVGPVPFTAANPRTAAPDDVGGNLRVASFNVLNFFNGNGTHQESAAGGFPTSRGANTLTESRERGAHRDRRPGGRAQQRDGRRYVRLCQHRQDRHGRDQGRAHLQAGSRDPGRTVEDHHDRNGPAVPRHEEPAIARPDIRAEWHWGTAGSRRQPPEVEGLRVRRRR